MKIILLIAFLACIAIESVGQQNQNKLFYAQKAEKYRRMKNTGATLTVAGGILTVVGIVTIANATYETVYTPTGTYTTATSGNPGPGRCCLFVGNRWPGCRHSFINCRRKE